MILIDTGYFLALLDSRDSLHARAQAWASVISESSVVTEYVLWETITATSELIKLMKTPKLTETMKPKVYIETTIVSYLTARPSRDIIIAGHQQITHDWWDRRHLYDLVVSQLVLHEAGAGDPIAAQERLDQLATARVLEVNEGAVTIAKALVDSGALPAKAAEDALHVGVAVTNGADYLLTWNCRHLANASLRAMIDNACRKMGYRPVIICTPEELMEV